MSRSYEIREEDRQAIVLAVAKLSISRPGWTMMLREIAEGTFKAGAMFDEFVSMGPDETLHVAEVPGIKVAGYELLAKASHADAGQIVAAILLPLLHAATLSEEAKADG